MKMGQKENRIGRRGFIGTMLGATFATAGLGRAMGQDLQDSVFMPDISPNVQPKQIIKPEIIKPLGLKKGDTIVISAQASHISIWEIRHCMKYFRKLGLKVETDRFIKASKNKYRYLAAPDDERAEVFMELIGRPEVKLIISGRGGYGSMRMLHMLDYDEIARNPKILIGYSDITALLNAINVKTNMVTFHGPVAASTFNSFTDTNLKPMIFHQDNFEPLKVKNNRAHTIVDGQAEGGITGGNLSILTATLGTEYEIETDGKILFIEEVSEQAYKVDKMLTQLYLAGKFDNCRAVVLGYFKNLNTRRSFFPGKSYTVKEVLNMRFADMKIPVMYGASFGHVKDKFTFPIGSKAEVDTKKHTIVFTEAPVV